ncbi:MAG TPA: hypothetical protein VKU41_03200 [Polyangiaceae bacterium]|nr:hypothetical protein [Polyangiaceae bacterium]
MKGFTDLEPLLYVFGVGFNFVSLPNYDDLSGAPPPGQTQLPAPANQ